MGHGHNAKYKLVCNSKADVTAHFGQNLKRQIKGTERPSFWGDTLKQNTTKGVTIVGLGPDRTKTRKLYVHAKLADKITAMFEKIKQVNRDYHIYSIGSKCVRYMKNTNTRQVIRDGPDYAAARAQISDWNRSWPSSALKYDSQHNRIQWRKVSNHFFATAIDINPGTNPFKKGKAFDIPKWMVHIFRDFGFGWGGYYHDYMHFEYELKDVSPTAAVPSSKAPPPTQPPPAPGAPQPSDLNPSSNGTPPAGCHCTKCGIKIEPQAPGTTPGAPAPAPGVVPPAGASIPSGPEGTCNDGQLSEIAKKIKQRFPDGISVIIFARLNKRSGNNIEVDKQSHYIAKEEQTVSVVGGQLTMGGEAIAIRDFSEVMNNIRLIHDTLLAEFKKAGGTGNPPRWTRIKRLGLGAHGMPSGMGMHCKNKYQFHYGPDFFKPKRKPETISTFVNAVKHCLTPDVNVALFSCSCMRDVERQIEVHKKNLAAGAPKKCSAKNAEKLAAEGQKAAKCGCVKCKTKKASIYWEWKTFSDEVPHARGSFGDKLAKALGGDASVFGHGTPGHFQRNFSLKVVGKLGGPGPGGIHVFNMLFPKTFLQGLAQQYGGGKPKYFDDLRSVACRYYKKLMVKRSFSKEHIPMELGKFAPFYPLKATQMLQENFKKMLEKAGGSTKKVSKMIPRRKSKK